MSSVSLGAAPAVDRAERADCDAALVTFCFSVQAVAEPGVMPRILELFAKRGLVPQKWQSTVAGTVLAIDVQTGELGRDTADYIARCMRQIAGVDAVLTSVANPKFARSRDQAVSEFRIQSHTPNL